MSAPVLWIDIGQLHGWQMAGAYMHRMALARCLMPIAGKHGPPGVADEPRLRAASLGEPNGQSHTDDALFARHAHAMCPPTSCEISQVARGHARLTIARCADQRGDPAAVAPRRPHHRGRPSSGWHDRAIRASPHTGTALESEELHIEHVGEVKCILSTGRVCCTTEKH